MKKGSNGHIQREELMMTLLDDSSETDELQLPPLKGKKQVRRYDCWHCLICEVGIEVLNTCSNAQNCRKSLSHKKGLSVEGQIPLTACL